MNQAERETEIRRTRVKSQDLINQVAEGLKRLRKRVKSQEATDAELQTYLQMREELDALLAKTPSA